MKTVSDPSEIIQLFILYTKYPLFQYLLTPWRIGTLKYLEIKSEEWPNRAKWGQSGPNGAKWCQMMPNRVKRVQTGSNGLKRGRKGPYGAKLGQKGQTGQTKPNGVKWGWFFCMHAYFYEIKKSCLATQAIRLKLAEILQYCYFLGYYRPSLKALLLFLYLSEEDFFYIIWKLMYIALFWATTLNF